MQAVQITHYTLTIGPGGNWLRLTRNATPFRDLDAVNEAVAELTPLLRSRAGRGVRFLLDLTQGPSGRNDPEFEKATARLRQLYTETFPDRRILVRSAVGRLQVLRLNPRMERDSVFIDEEAARRWLEHG
jgi:hypothetical protein